MADQPEGVIMGGSAGHEAGLVENPVTLIDVIVPPVVLLALATGPYILLSRAKERRIGWATLVRILGPFSLTLLVFPLVMWIRSPIIDYFWGGEDNRRRRVANTAFSAFLVPNATLYALLFTRLVQKSLSRVDSLAHLLDMEVSAASQIHNLVLQLRESMSSSMASQLTRHLTATLEGTRREVEEGGTNWSGNAGQTDAFNCLTLFREVVSSDAEGAFIFEEAVNTVTKHSYARWQRVAKLMDRHSFFHWALLEMMSLVTLLGVLFLEQESPQLNLSMCMLIAFTIALLNLFLAELEEPFHGFVKVNESALVRQLSELNGKAKRAF